jgi:hypothetical protein
MSGFGLGALTHDELSQFTGDLERYRHPFNRRVIFTPGVRHMAERAGAYWLIDLIASYIGTPELTAAIKDDERLGEMHFWRLDVPEDGPAVASCRADSDVPPVITQTIEFTDFPLDHIEVWAGFDGQHWTLYLPSEH